MYPSISLVSLSVAGGLPTAAPFVTRPVAPNALPQAEIYVDSETTLEIPTDAPTSSPTTFGTASSWIAGRVARWGGCWGGRWWWWWWW